MTISLKSCNLEPKPTFTREMYDIIASRYSSFINHSKSCSACYSLSSLSSSFLSKRVKPFSKLATHSHVNTIYNIAAAAPVQDPPDSPSIKGRQHITTIAGTLGASRSNLELTINVFGLSRQRFRSAMLVMVNKTMPREADADQRA